MMQGSRPQQLDNDCNCWLQDPTCGSDQSYFWGKFAVYWYSFHNMK